MSYPWLYSPAAERHRILPGNSLFPVPLLAGV